MQIELQKTERELRIRNYSPKTVKSYLYDLQEHFSFKGNDFAKFEQESIKNFLLHCEENKSHLKAETCFSMPLLFVGVPHILHKGSVDIAELPIIIV